MTLDELYDFPKQAGSAEDGGFLSAKDFVPNVPKVLILRKKERKDDKPDAKYPSPDGMVRWYHVEQYLPDMSVIKQVMTFSRPTAIYIAMQQAGIMIDDAFSLTWNGKAQGESRFECVKLTDISTIENILADAKKKLADQPARPTKTDLDNMFGSQS